MKKAWIQKFVRDAVGGDPTQLFTPDVAAHYDTDIDDDVQPGAQWDGEKWVNPPARPAVEPPEEPASSLQIGPIAFQLLFTMPEMVAIDAAKATDPAVRLFWGILTDPRTDAVDRSLQSVQSAIQYLEQKGYIAQGRAEQIINGQPQ